MEMNKEKGCDCEEQISGQNQQQQQCSSSSSSSSSSNLQKNPETKKARTCKGTLYYSSNLKSKSKNPRCIGLSGSRSLPKVPDNIMFESEVANSKRQSLADFRYVCAGYSVYLDNKGVHPTGTPTPQPEWLFCAGLKLLIDKRPAEHQAPAQAQVQPQPQPHAQDDNRVIPQPRPQKTPHLTGEEYLTKFTRNAGLVASGVAKNMRKVSNFIKESIDDLLFKRPK